MPRGGPNGGDGGIGGSIFLYGDQSLNTLLHLKYHSTWRGERGGHGRGQNKQGGNGEDTHIPVPIGTVLWNLNEEDGERTFLADIVDPTPVLVSQGGAGGLGNARFVSATQQEPVLAERGGLGDQRSLILELKLLADVGLVGKPNAGKSTLLSACSAAKPKIAAYPFTTLDPVLGVVETRDRSFVVMEVPGLIEGAHEGAGLGHEFLRHAERSRLLLHLVDGTAEDPVQDLEQLNLELRSFDPRLGEKPQLIVITKQDLPEARDRAEILEQELEGVGCPIFFVSGATGQGIAALMGKTLEIIDSLPKTEAPAQTQGIVRKRALSLRRSPGEFHVYRRKGAYIIDAPRVERLLPMANLKDWRAMVQIWKELDRLGVVKALEEEGVQPGDTVLLGGVELEWY